MSTLNSVYQVHLAQPLTPGQFLENCLQLLCPRPNFWLIDLGKSLMAENGKFSDMCGSLKPKIHRNCEYLELAYKQAFTGYFWVANQLKNRLFYILFYIYFVLGKRSSWQLMVGPLCYKSWSVHFCMTVWLQSSSRFMISMVKCKKL